MKIYLKIAILALFITNSLVSAQNKLNKIEGSLWLTSEKIVSDAPVSATQKKEATVSHYFNFNSAIDFSQSKTKQKTKNIIRNQSSLFLVYKGADAAENKLVVIQKGNFNVTVTSKKIQIDKEIELNKGNAEKGMMVSCLFSNNSALSKKSGSLTVSDLLFMDREHKNQLFELIYIPKVVNNKEREIIESYLSIKYGISLNGAKNYYDSKGTKIWNVKENEEFNHRVTGLGKDASSGLDQKQSGNNEKDGLYMSLGKLEKTNSQNKSLFTDRTFLMWGDNGKSSLMENENTGNAAVKKMKRIWKVQATSDSLHGSNRTQIVIDRKEMSVGDKEKETVAAASHYWLAVDTTSTNSFDYSSAKYSKASLENEEKLVFDAVLWASNSNAFFTIVKAPDFFATYTVLPLSCLAAADGKINIQLVGGTAPYKVEISSTDFKKDMILQTNHLELDNLPNGEYTLKVSDAKNTFKSTFNIDPFQDYPVTLEKEYVVDNDQELEIVPAVASPKTIKTYAWYNNNQLLSSESTFRVKNSGSYKLVVTNQNGCEKELPFEVKNKSAIKDGQWVLFPNPVAFGQNFKIQFQWPVAFNTTVFIHDLNGKLIKKYPLGLIKEYVLNENRLPGGTYLVTISKDGNNETTKLIIQ